MKQEENGEAIVKKGEAEKEKYLKETVAFKVKDAMRKG